jgi:hypothetical protein
LLQHEVDRKEVDIVRIPGQGRISLPAKAGCTAQAAAAAGTYDFVFDAVYRIDSPKNSRGLFTKLVMPVVEKFCQGFNGAVLAYGQTGSGKVSLGIVARPAAEALQRAFELSAYNMPG